MNDNNQQAARELLPGCDYQGYEFGGGYLDSVCINGCLHDADNCDGERLVYLNDDDIPCPMCRPLDSIEWWYEQNVFSWDDDEDMEDEEGHNKRARDAAVSLVTDIRKNRGAETDLAELAAPPRPTQERSE